MATTAYIKELNVGNNTEEIVYPVTKAAAVWMDDNNTTVQNAVADLITKTNYAGLTKVTTATSGNYIPIMVSNNNRAIDYNNLAKAIIENYNSSTLADQAQSVKQALDTLNSNISSGLIGATIPDGTKLLTTLCLEQTSLMAKNYIVNSSSLASAVGLPSGYVYCYIIMTKISNYLAEILVYPISSNVSTIPVRNIYTANGWSGWINFTGTILGGDIIQVTADTTAPSNVFQTPVTTRPHYFLIYGLGSTKYMLAYCYVRSNTLYQFVISTSITNTSEYATLEYTGNKFLITNNSTGYLRGILISA